MPSLKYAVVERERRYVVRSLPEGVSRVSDIVDRYVMGTRLRLREVTEQDGTVVRKLGHKVRLGEGPAEVACTSLYVDDDEWRLLEQLPAHTVRKRRHHIERDGLHVVVDQFEGGALVAEIDDGVQSPTPTPNWLDVEADVSGDELWTGASIAASGLPLLRAAGR